MASRLAGRAQGGSPEERPERLPDRRTALARLDAGGVLLLPTDTLPGLHCRADRPVGLRRLRGLKNRPKTKPLLLLCADADQALDWSDVPEERRREYARQVWPGPFTLILPAVPAVDPLVTGGGATVALRVPARADLRRFLAAVGVPLVSTSANVAGRDAPTELDVAAACFAGDLDGVAGDWLPDTRPSRSRLPLASALIDLTVWPPQVLRPGPAAPPTV